MIMGNKKIALTAVSVIGLLIGYIFSNSTKFGICTHEQYSCRELFNNIGDPLFYGSGALALVFLILLFVPQAFPAWKKFAIWFVPLAVILFAIYPEPGSGDLFSPYPEQIYRWVSGFYVVVSGAIIAISVIKNKNQA
jgi:hypothetical protein